MMVKILSLHLSLYLPNQDSLKILLQHLVCNTVVKLWDRLFHMLGLIIQEERIKSKKLKFMKILCTKKILTLDQELYSVLTKRKSLKHKVLFPGRIKNGDNFGLDQTVQPTSWDWDGKANMETVNMPLNFNTTIKRLIQESPDNHSGLSMEQSSILIKV